MDNVIQQMVRNLKFNPGRRIYVVRDGMVKNYLVKERRYHLTQDAYCCFRCWTCYGCKPEDDDEIVEVFPDEPIFATENEAWIWYDEHKDELD